MLSVTPWNTAESVIESVTRAVSDVAGKSLSFAETLAGSIGRESATDDDSPSIDQLRESLAAKRDELTDAIARQLKSLGIDPAGTLELEFDADGDFRAPAGHPAASRIELLLNTNDAIRQQATDLYSLHNELELSDIASRAERLSEIDPRAAAELRLRASERSGDPRTLVV